MGTASFFSYFQPKTLSVLSPPNMKGNTMADIIYEDESHTYKLDGKPLRSVTDIASEICRINKDFFKTGAAAIGTDVHTELGRYYDPRDEFSSKDFTMDLAAKMALFLKPEANFLTEVIVHNKDYGYAGTIDLLSIRGDDVLELVDFKSGGVNKKYCTVQLSLYKLALESMGYNCSETRCRVISPKGITKIEPLSWDDVWNLAPSELDATEEEKIHAMELRLQELEPYVDEYKAIESDLRALLLSQLTTAGATKYSGCVFDVSYVGPSVRVGLDTARLRAEMPDVFEAYQKETNVSGTIKMTKKKEN